MIGIIVAMDKELRLLLPLLEDCEDVVFKGYTFHHGRFEGKEVIVAKSGIGKVNAALCTAVMIDGYAPSLIINTGVAGGTGAGAGIMDVVVGDRIAYHDVWCGPGTQWGEAAGCPLFFESNPACVALDCLNGDPSVKHGLVCSGDIFVDSPAVIERIRERFPEAVAVDMESASIAQTCYLRGVPFLCIRVLSDTPGDNENNIEQYDDFWGRAPERTFDIITKVIKEL